MVGLWAIARDSLISTVSFDRIKQFCGFAEFGTSFDLWWPRITTRLWVNQGRYRVYSGWTLWCMAIQKVVQTKNKPGESTTWKRVKLGWSPRERYVCTYNSGIAPANELVLVVHSEEKRRRRRRRQRRLRRRRWSTPRMTTLCFLMLTDESPTMRDEFPQKVQPKTANSHTYRRIYHTKLIDSEKAARSGRN